MMMMMMMLMMMMIGEGGYVLVVLKVRICFSCRLVHVGNGETLR